MRLLKPRCTYPGSARSRNNRSDSKAYLTPLYGQPKKRDRTAPLGVQTAFGEYCLSEKKTSILKRASQGKITSVIGWVRQSTRPPQPSVPPAHKKRGPSRSLDPWFEYRVCRLSPAILAMGAVRDRSQRLRRGRESTIPAIANGVLKPIRLARFVPGWSKEISV
jgi:hypothetical protein